MRSSRLPHPDKQSYWASNFVYGFGTGTSSLIRGVLGGVSGIIY
jgi:hypothetical protein